MIRKIIHIEMCIRDRGKGYSETTAAEIDSEMRDIIDEAYETCRRTLTEHIDQLHACLLYTSSTAIPTARWPTTTARSTTCRST